MTPGRARRLLLAAFAISLLIHAIVAFVWHRPRATPPPETEVVTISHITHMTKLQTPPPRPKHTPAPHPVASARPAPRASHGVQATPGVSGTGHASPAPTPVPTAVATVAAAGCNDPNAEAAVTENPPPGDVPVAARTDGTSGITLIKVQLDAQGTVTGAAVSQSSGNPSLDLVAVAMARDAKYSPALNACKAIASTYDYSVKFVAW